MITATHPQFTRQQYRVLHSKAEKLRGRGLSYKEIQKEIPISKSTVSEWCRDIQLTPKQIKRLGAKYDTQLRGAKANQLKSRQRKQQARLDAMRETVQPTTDTLKAAGAMLYWAEGDKQGGTGIANSDPTLVVFYVKWLDKALNIKPNRLTAYLHLHQGQNDKEEKRFWSKITNIPLENFRKTFFKPTGTGHRKNILYHGVLRVRVNGTGTELLRHRILGWAEAIARYFVPEKIIAIHYRGRTGR